MKRTLSFFLALVMLCGMMPMTAFATEEAEKNPWEGRSAVFVGDSITAGSGTTKLYYRFLEESLGFSSVTGMGIGGSCISSGSDYGNNNTPLINRYKNIPSADLIQIFMGTNDYGHATPIGSPEDTQAGTFYGALNTIIPYLLETHKESKIVFVTPLHRNAKSTGTTSTSEYDPNASGHTLHDYVEAIKQVCATHGVSVIDLYTESEMDPRLDPKNTAYFPDGLHPNAAGHELIAGIMASHLREYEPVKNEPIVQTELIQGNKFSTGNDQPCRASSRINYYLKAGTVITLKNPDVMQWSCAKTNGEISSTNLGYFPDSQWTDKETAVVAEDGWVGFVFKYRDETKAFDLTKLLSDFITIEEPHIHSYEPVVTTPTCTEQGYTTYTCACGDSYVDDYMGAVGHNFQNGICTGCGEELEPIKSHIGVSNTMGSTSGTHLEVIDFPVLPYSVYEISDGIYGLEDILSTKTEALAAYYVDSKSGSDDNSGTAENAPFRTLKKALTAAAGKAVEITILNENAVFFMDELYGNYAVNHTTVIKAKTGATILGGIRDAGFTLLDGYTNTYVSNSLSGYTIQNGDGVSAVVDTDARNVDEMGIYRALLPVSSVDEVESTKGSYYYDAEVARMYVNPRYNIESVYPLTATYPFRFNLSKAVGDTLLYMENLNVIGGFLLYGRSAACDSDFRNLEFVANNCTFQHNLLNNCVSVNNFNGSYMVDCRVGYSLLDGYNYHAANLTTAQRLNAVHVEVNCQAEYCGYYRMMFGVGVVNNNLSTAHEGINVLRVNFSGHDSYGPQIADVNGCRSVNIDCRISNSYQYKGSAGNFQFTQTSAIRNANITLINCYAYDSRSGELRLYSNVKRTTVVGGNLLESRFYTVIGDLLTEAQEHPHDYTAVVTAPTCAEQGYTTYTCTLC